MEAQAPDSALEWVLAGVGGVTFIVIVVALQNFFVQPPTLTRRQRLFQDVSVLFGVVHFLALLVLDSAGDRWTLAGIALYGISFALFLSAVEAARRVPMMRTFVYSPSANAIVTTGPYRLIRHPMYVAYSLCWFAAPVATHERVLAVTAIIMTICYVLSAREEERILLAGPRSAEYAAMRARTWRMIPLIY